MKKDVFKILFGFRKQTAYYQSSKFEVSKLTLINTFKQSVIAIPHYY